MSRLNTEEKEILEAYEKGKLKRSKNAVSVIEKQKVIAAATFKKDARINIRLSSKDLRALQVRALKAYLIKHWFPVSYTNSQMVNWWRKRLPSNNTLSHRNRNVWPDPRYCSTALRSLNFPVISNVSLK